MSGDLTSEKIAELRRLHAEYGEWIANGGAAPSVTVPVFAALPALLDAAAEKAQHAWLLQHGDEVIAADAEQIRVLAERAEKAEARVKALEEAATRVCKCWVMRPSDVGEEIRLLARVVLPQPQQDKQEEAGNGC